MSNQASPNRDVKRVGGVALNPLLVAGNRHGWGMPGALLALIAGVAFIALTLREGRQTVASVEPASARAD